MFSPNNALIKQANCMNLAAKYGAACELPTIDRRKSLNTRKLRNDSVDAEERRNLLTHSLDMHQVKANLRLMMKKIKTQAVGIKSRLPDIDRSDIAITSAIQTPFDRVQSPHNPLLSPQQSDQQPSRIHKKADNTPYFIKKYKLTKLKPLSKPQTDTSQTSSVQNRVPIFSVKLLRAITRNVDNSTEKRCIHNESVKRSQMSVSGNAEQFEMNMKNSKGIKASNGRLIISRESPPKLQYESLQKLVHNEDAIERTLLNVSNDKINSSSSYLLRVDNAISPWN